MGLNKDAVAAPFIEVEETEEGYLKNITFKNDDNFNFAYDVVDKLAKKDPDKVAMLHISKDGKERSFTFYDISNSVPVHQPTAAFAVRFFSAALFSCQSPAKNCGDNITLLFA